MKKAFLFLVACLLATPPAARAGVHELSVALTWSAIHPAYLYVAELCRTMEEKSDGRLRFHVYDNSTLVKNDGMFRAVRDGGADIVFLAPAFVPSDLPHSLTHDMPFLSSDAVKSAELLWAMRDLPAVRAELEKGNAEALWAFSSARSGLLSLRAPVRAPADIQGKRVLIWQANMGDEVKAWGGIPVLVSVPDTYTALQRGMGEVLYGPVPMFASMKLQEVARHLTIMPSMFSGAWFPVNKDSMAALPEDLQRLIRTETRDATRGMSRAIEQAFLRDCRTLEEGGVEIVRLTPEELAPWKEASVPAMTPYYRGALQRAGDADPDAWMAEVSALARKVEEGNAGL